MGGGSQKVEFWFVGVHGPNCQRIPKTPSQTPPPRARALASGLITSL